MLHVNINDTYTQSWYTSKMCKTTAAAVDVQTKTNKDKLNIKNFKNQTVACFQLVRMRDLI